MTARAPNLSEKLAATILAWLHASGRGIPHEHQKAMSPHQVISLVQFDHYPIRRESGGSNHPSNLRPLLILGHREKTAKVDQPEIAKTRALTASQIEFRRKVLAKPCGQKRERTGAWPTGRKIQGRGFQRGNRT